VTPFVQLIYPARKMHASYYVAICDMYRSTIWST